MENQLVQDARWFMGVPPGVDICAAFEEEVRHVEVTVDDGPGERRVENVLRSGLVPLEVHTHLWAVAGKMIVQITQRRRAGFVKPALHLREITHACRMRQIARQRPDAGECWNE